MKMKTKNFSRFLVALFWLLIWQSSLGTSAAKIYDQKLLQNGYRKYDDGFMIQWGTKANSIAGSAIVYLPANFYDENYIVVPSALGSASEAGALTAQPYSFSKTSFYVGRKWTGNGTTANTYFSFVWVAVGRWK